MLIGYGSITLNIRHLSHVLDVAAAVGDVLESSSVKDDTQITLTSSSLGASLIQHLSKILDKLQ